MTKQMPEGFPKTKKPKKASSGWLKPMSDKTRSRMAERKQVIEETHKRAKGQCAAYWIAPDINCSRVLDCDEVIPRSGGGDPYSMDDTQTLCRKCHTVKGLEVSASEILSLYGKARRDKHIPISEKKKHEAIEVFRNTKERCHF